MLVCNVVQVFALWNISVETNFSYFCSVLTRTGNLLDLWSFGRQLPRRLLGSEKVGSFCLVYLYIDLFRVRSVVQKGNVQVCRKL